MRASPLVALSLLSALGVGWACSSGSSDTTPHDAAVFDLALELPPGCPPGQANEKGVGKLCTMGGGQCASPLHCTCDPYLGIQLYGVPCVCTLVGLNADPANAPNACTNVAAGTCGTGATCCPYMTFGYFCSPDTCLPGGACIDFSAADAGTD
jgi:hypothetical protein